MWRHGKARLAQQPGDPLSAHMHTLIGKLGVDTWGAVDAVGGRMDLLDTAPQGVIGEGALGGRPPSPGVVARTRHTEHAGKAGDGVVWLLFVDQAIPHRG